MQVQPLRDLLVPLKLCFNLHYNERILEMYIFVSDVCGGESSPAGAALGAGGEIAVSS